LTDNVIPFRGTVDGGGPEDPALERRVTQLEEDMRFVKATLGRLEPLIVEIHRDMARRSELNEVRDRLAETREEVKEMKGALSRSPTINHLLAATISTWIAGAGIVFAVMRLPTP
jgi:uncharacterized coiled-coil protein SlyX